MAIGDGLDSIRLGRADVMLCGGTEAAVNEVGMAGFAAMRALSQRNDDPTRASRPFDAKHITEPDPTGPVRAFDMALSDAGVAKDAIDYVNAHATSTPVGDISETKMLKLAIGEENARSTPVSGTKGATGHCLGAAGAIEATFTVLAIRDGKLPPTINYEVADPECDLDYVPNEARDADVKIAVSNSFGFGGQNACVVFQKFES